MWDILLLLKSDLDQLFELPKTIFLKTKGQLCIEWDVQSDDWEVKVELLPAIKETANPFAENAFDIELRYDETVSSTDLQLLKLYLPYTFMGVCARIQRKCFSISHFAQTLDGKIASCTGDSKWIGNDENLIHAHRMRALCDAILVGARTVETDDPRLNVRMVSGEDPVKVILGGNGQWSRNVYKAINKDTLIFQEGNEEETIYTRVRILKQPEYNPKAVLEELSSRGIRSVYVEGGSRTSSSFLMARALDQVQLHFSAKIIGSGSTSFQFDGLNTIEEAITFESSQFVPIGNEMMFVGNLTND